MKDNDVVGTPESMLLDSTLPSKIRCLVEEVGYASTLLGILYKYFRKGGPLPIHPFIVSKQVDLWVCLLFFFFIMDLESLGIFLDYGILWLV